MTYSLEPSRSSSESAKPARAGWRWRLETSAGEEVSPSSVESAGAGQTFPSQGDAESWLGEQWRELLDQGVDQVTLFDEEREVYGPMSLHASG